MESVATKSPLVTSEVSEKQKRVVHYKEASNVILYGRAIVLPIDHTSNLVTNTTYAITSPIVKVYPQSGDFETENSIYRRA